MLLIFVSPAPLRGIHGPTYDGGLAPTALAASATQNVASRAGRAPFHISIPSETAQRRRALVGCGMITQGQLGVLLTETGFANARVAEQPLPTRFVMLAEKPS
jgi:hypothetical protein